jgi:hypothetical protein
MGLRDSHHISRIAIDPGQSECRLRRRDGTSLLGQSGARCLQDNRWRRHLAKSLFINDRVGIIDLVMDPSNPSVLYAAAYDKQRLPWQIVNGGPDTGIYKTTDGGVKWTKLAGGLPTGRIGRIGLDIYLKNPQILYAVVENANPRAGAPRTRTDQSSRWAARCIARPTAAPRGQR